MVFLGGCTQLFSSSKHGKSSWCQVALFWSHLTTSPSPKPPPDHPGVLWQNSEGPVHVCDGPEDRTGEMPSSGVIPMHLHTTCIYIYWYYVMLNKIVTLGRLREDPIDYIYITNAWTCADMKTHKLLAANATTSCTLPQRVCTNVNGHFKPFVKNDKQWITWMHVAHLFLLA